LGAHEVKQFFAAVFAEPPLYRDFVMFAILTAARRGNCQAARWDEIDWTFKSWRIPKTKTGKPQTVPLTDAAIALLRLRQKDANGSPWIFPSVTGPGHLIDPRKSWRRILKTSGLSDLRIHDLRRSTASWAALQGESLLVIGKMLGHESTEATKVYARLGDDPIRASLTTATGAMLATAGVQVQLIGATQLPAPDETDDQDEPTEF
jgi:integrase